MITEVKEIPLSINDQRAMRRAAMRKDIMEAWNRNIEKCEITGDYTYSTLHNNLREEARNIFVMLFKETPEFMALTKDQKQVLRINSHVIKSAALKVFKVSSNKQEDRVHVFLTIDKEQFTPEVNKLIKLAIGEAEKAKQRKAQRR